ncbi:acyltransferase family protein [Microbacterium hydrocarbonoxydans]|uniref:acyltransferase family protein n=1 Tax=Microbacterium hydrocarbonoxydans TaxID=273678 RepID=UPI0013DB644B|nr:acyltransferase [Microbacterium hydrocarbonoxydans]
MPTPKRVEFRYLDGLRGGAALLVAAYHAYLFTGRTGDAEAAMPLWKEVIGLGYVGVPVFIVLSGYVLMLPVTRTRDLTFRGGVGAFIKRRARRILPPYYAAMAFALLLIAIVPVMQQPTGTAWDSKLPVTLESVVAHLLLLHNLSPHQMFTINGPLWSVALEWQIYFVMSFALLPLWRRLPSTLVVGALLVVTMIPVALQTGTFAHPWLVALFAVGMLAAQLTLSNSEQRWAGPTTITLALAIIPAAALPRLFDVPADPFVEVIAGLAVASALIWAGRRTLSSGTPRAAVPFQSRPMMFLGLISYSIYLFHSPILGLFNLLLLPLQIPTVMLYMLVTFVGLPLAVGVAYLMFWLIERHFLNSHQRHAAQEISSSADRGVKHGSHLLGSREISLRLDALPGETHRTVQREQEPGAPRAWRR